MAALGYEVTATNLQRVLLRRGVLEPTGEMAPPGPGRRAAGGALPLRRAALEVTDPFAVLRPPSARRPERRRLLAEALRFPRGLPAEGGATCGSSPGRNRCPAQARGSTTVTTIEGRGDASGAPRAAGDAQRPGAGSAGADGRDRVPGADPGRPRPAPAGGHRRGSRSTSCRARRSTTARSSASALGRLRAKLSYTNIGFALAPPSFTIAELRDIYVAALGYERHRHQPAARSPAAQRPGADRRSCRAPGPGGRAAGVALPLRLPGAGGHRPVRGPAPAVGPHLGLTSASRRLLEAVFLRRPCGFLASGLRMAAHGGFVARAERLPGHRFGGAPA